MQTFPGSRTTTKGSAGTSIWLPLTTVGPLSKFISQYMKNFCPMNKRGGRKGGTDANLGLVKIVMMGFHWSLF